MRVHGSFFDAANEGTCLRNTGDPATGYRRVHGRPRHAEWKMADKQIAATAPVDEKTLEAKRAAACSAMHKALNAVPTGRARKRAAVDQRTTESKKKKADEEPCTGQIKIAVSPVVYLMETTMKQKLLEEAIAHRLTLPKNATKKDIGQAPEDRVQRRTSPGGPRAASDKGEHRKRQEVPCQQNPPQKKKKKNQNWHKTRKSQNVHHHRNVT